MARALAIVVLVPLGLGCSLIDGNFDECQKDSDCPSWKSCEVNPAAPGAHVCLPMPEGCFGVPVANVRPTYGENDEGSIHLGATINLTSGQTVNANKVQNLNAMWMAIDEINQNLGTGHQKFVLHACDNESDSSRIQPQVEWLTQVKHVPAIIIPGSANELNAAQYTIPAGVMIMSPTATSPSITAAARVSDGGVPLLWRTAPSDVLQGRVISDVLWGQSPFDGGSDVASAQRVGIIYSNETYGIGLQQVIEDDFNQRASGSGPDPRQIRSFAYPRGGDVTGAVAQLSGWAPGVTVCIGFPSDVPNIINAAAGTATLAASSGHRWIFTDAAQDPSIVARLSDPSQIATAFGTAPAQTAGAAYPAFAQRFFSRFEVDPASYGFTSHSYDAMYLLALAASFAVGPSASGQPSGLVMADGLTRVSDPNAAYYRLQPSDFIGARVDLQSGKPVRVEGASGNMRFDPATGESPAPIEIWQVSGASIQTLSVIAPPQS